MLDTIAKWKTGRSYSVDTQPVEELYFGSIRVARVIPENRSNVIAGKDHSYTTFIYRISLPGFGTRDAGFAYTIGEAKDRVEDLALEWLTDTGLNQVEETFVIPDDIVVLESIKPPAEGSRKIVPLEQWRRDGSKRPSTDTHKKPRKSSHAGRRALTRGQ